MVLINTVHCTHHKCYISGGKRKKQSGSLGDLVIILRLSYSIPTPLQMSGSGKRVFSMEQPFLSGDKVQEKVSSIHQSNEALRAITLHCSFMARSWASFLSRRAVNLTFSSISFWTSVSFCIFSPSNCVVFATSLIQNKIDRQSRELNHNYNIAVEAEMSKGA